MNGQEAVPRASPPTAGRLSHYFARAAATAKHYDGTKVPLPPFRTTAAEARPTSSSIRAAAHTHTGPTGGCVCVGGGGPQPATLLTRSLLRAAAAELLANTRMRQTEWLSRHFGVHSRVAAAATLCNSLQHSVRSSSALSQTFNV